jgi:hypothetical protein
MAELTFCLSTRVELNRDYPSLKLGDECPVCKIPIGRHQAEGISLKDFILSFFFHPTLSFFNFNNLLTISDFLTLSSIFLLLYDHST